MFKIYLNSNVNLYVLVIILRNKTLFVYKVFADWQRTELGERALSQLDLPDSAGRPFNDLSNNPFPLTQQKTGNDILDYESKLCYR